MTMSADRNRIRRVGIAGFGAVGQQVAVALREQLPELTLSAITSGSLEKARRRADELFDEPPPVASLEEVVDLSDLVVEAAPAEVFPEIARPTLEGGKSLLVLTVGALLGRVEEYTELARRCGGTIYVASGAIGGLDAITSASAGRVDNVVMTTRKPPKGVAGAPYIRENEIDLDAITEPTVIYEGTPGEAWYGFPANINVSVAVSLAGIGPHRTKLRIIVDPSIDRNMHDIEVTGEFGRFICHIENVPTGNPRSGRLTALSTIATLRKLISPLQVGT